MSTVTQIVTSRLGLPARALPVSASRTAAPGAPASAQVTLSSAAAAKAPTYTDRIKASGKNSVDALLAGGSRWFHESGASGSVPSLSARKTLTYSFIDSAEGLGSQDARGFQPLDASHRQRVRDALAYYSSIIDVSFVEVGAGGDLKYGANQQTNSAGYARYPGEGSQVMLATNDSSYGDWSEGGYGWQVLLHETGHALGLKHPGNYNAGGGGTPGPYLPGGQDHRGNTIMSYNSAGNMRRIVASGGSMSRVDVQASTLQGMDIAALQYLYGAAKAPAATTYRWDTDATLSQTIWNPNAGSAIDVSNQTKDNFIDLRAGRWSSIAIRDPYADTGVSADQYAKLKSGSRSIASILGKPSYDGRNNLFIAAGSRITSATGGSGNDTVVANGLGDTVEGGAGNDRVFWTTGNLTVDGGEGRDTVFVRKIDGAKWQLAADRSSLTLTRTGNTLATISLAGIEAVRLWDGTAYKATGAALYVA